MVVKGLAFWEQCQGLFQAEGRGLGIYACGVAEHLYHA